MYPSRFAMGIQGSAKGGENVSKETKDVEKENLEKEDNGKVKATLAWLILAFLSSGIIHSME